MFRATSSFSLFDNALFDYLLLLGGKLPIHTDLEHVPIVAHKEGIRGLSRVAATEWAPYGVRVNVICPLAMTEGLQKFKEEYPERYEQTIKGVPMGKFADPEKDVGGVCVFLCSDEASYVTGETITLQGGSGLRP